MTHDILTVMWKERKGLFRHQGSMRTVVLNVVVFVVIMGILLPIQAGRDYGGSPLALIGAAFVPALLVGMKIPDSFTGERERRTLATLLASRLPDEAILYGKVLTAVVYGWGMGLVVFLLGLVTVNIAHWEGEMLLYSPKIALLGVSLGLLVSLFVAGLGVLISLRSATVQGATQTLVFAVMVVPLILQVLGVVALGAGPRGREIVKSVFTTIGSTRFVAGTVAVLFVVDVGLLALARARFQRARLILG